jgi:glutaredoxin
MKSKPAFFGRTPALLALACVAAWGLSAQAQPVYRVVGPDGKVTFSDKPPADAKPAATVGGTSRPTDNKPALPYELQQLAGKYPVTLYSTNGCGPCDSGRALLTKRGIPFVEKTVNTNEDMAAFARISKENAMPFLMIGGQAVKGYSDSEWSSYLDAAGYPKQSALPASYRTAPAEPLSPLKTAAEAPALTDAAAPANGGQQQPPAETRRRPPPAPAVNPSNPAGIRF